MSEPEPRDDAARIRQALWTIRMCWPQMLPLAPRPPRAGIVGRAPDVPLPVPVSILDLRALTLSRLASWALVVADDQDLHTSLDGADALGLCRFLDTHADYLAAHPAAGDVLDELGDSARRCDRVVDHPGPLEFVGRCEVCSGDLRARSGGNALCRDCGASVDPVTTRESLVRQAEDRLLTAAEIVRLAHRLWDQPVTHVHLSRWVKRGLLPVKGRTPDEHALHRIGDVDALVSWFTRSESAV